MTEKLVMVLFNVFVLATILITQLLTTRIARKNILLGVRIPEKEMETQEVKDIIKGFKKQNLMIGIPTLIIISLIIFFTDNINFFILSIFMYIGILFLIYLRWNKKTSELKRRKKWHKLIKKERVVDTNISNCKSTLGVVSQKWFLIPLAIILLNIIIGLSIYPSLSDKVPIHWDLQGNIDGYMNKSISTVLLMPLMQLFLAVTIYLSYFFMKKAKRHINPRDPESSLKKNIIFRNVWSIYFISTLILVEILFTIMNMMTLELLTNIKLFNVFSFAITGLIIVGAIILAVIVGQGGDRLKIGDDDKSSSNYDIDDDKQWVFGNTIYFNTRDNSIFVEKRVGIGWTVNIGRPLGLILMIFPIIIIILALIVAR